MIKVIQVGYGYWGESWVQYLRDDPNFELKMCIRDSTYTVAVRVLEAPWIYLIEYTLFPPTPFELHALHLTLV